MVEKKYGNIEWCWKKFYSPFGIDGLYEYHTIIIKKEDDENVNLNKSKY